ncbi:uncharacterized protein LOC141810900 [Halichoeres trimaculatus]|uniref:uncharacterized protein LOC141810900 n=1 Tax=Halichoeres trimaculatus TaxID=147232 RepID=UPI003D9DCE5C
MGKISLIVIFLLGGLWETAALQVTGVSGQNIEIKCSHSYASSNFKYFCKGACNDEDVLISSKWRKQDSRTKYSIRDTGNIFYVTIFRLTESDSGTYWCGIERTGIDTYNKVVLTVKEGKQKNRSIDRPESMSNEASSWKLVYIGVGLGVVVLALATALLIFFRRRKRDIRGSSAKVQETVYASVSGPTDTSTTNKDQDTADPGKDPTKNIYSNVSVPPEPQVQQDGLFYSTVSFNKHTDCSTVMPETAEVTYSTIECKRDETSTVYSNVGH